MKQFPESKKNIFLDKIKHISNVLYALDLYKTYMITDAIMVIENKPHNRTFYYGRTKITVKHQKYFIHIIVFSEFPILVYIYIINGNIPRIVFVFKVDKGNDDTSVQLKQALEV